MRCISELFAAAGVNYVLERCDKALDEAKLELQLSRVAEDRIKYINQAYL